jgi:hypothetical protein
MAECQAWSAIRASYGYPGGSCSVGTVAGDPGTFVLYTPSSSDSVSNSGVYGPFPACPAANPCQTAWPSTPINADGSVTTGTTMCRPGTPDSNGATPSCEVSMTPTGPPTFDGSAGKWYTPITVAASGDICGADPGIKNAGGTTPNSPPDNIPLQPPTNVTPAPSICGDGTCYNPNNQDFCATGGSPCIPAATGDGPGGCNSVGDVTICAGTPNAPAPPIAAVPDPPTEIQSDDGYKQANPTTGAVIPVSVPVYSTGAQSTGGAGTLSPGSATGPAGTGTSSAPASSSTAGKGSYGGGGDCNTPPACTGDAVMCGVVQQTWYVRCGKSLEDKNGNGQPDWTELSDADNAPYAVTPAANADVITTNTVDTGVIDQTSWAGNSCPSLPSAVTEFGTLVLGDQDFFCNWLAAIRAIVLLAGSFISVRILTGSQA